MEAHTQRNENSVLIPPDPQSPITDDYLKMKLSKGPYLLEEVKTYEEIQSLAAALIKQVGLLPESSRLEVHWPKVCGDSYSIKLALHPGWWLNTYLPRIVPNERERTKIANDWTIASRKEFSVGTPSFAAPQTSDGPQELKVGGSSDSDPAICKHQIFNRSRVSGEGTCDWKHNPKLNIIELCDDFWIMRIRSPPTYTRQFLLCPRPISSSISMNLNDRNDGQWKGHYNNADLLALPLLWKKLKEVEKVLEGLIGKENQIIECTALNFGQWESAQSADHDLEECHGHVHIILSRKAQEVLAALDDYKPLSGRTDDPPFYHLDNVVELEKVVLPLMIRHIYDELTKMAKHVAGLEASAIRTDAQMTQMTQELREVKYGLITFAVAAAAVCAYQFISHR